MIGCYLTPSLFVNSKTNPHLTMFFYFSRTLPMATTMFELTMTATSQEPVSLNMCQMLARSTLPLSFPHRAPCMASNPPNPGFMTSPSGTQRPRPHAPTMSSNSHNNRNNSKLPQFTPRSQSTLAPPTCPPLTAAPSLTTSSLHPTRRSIRMRLQTRPAKCPIPPAFHTHLRKCHRSSLTMAGLRSNACRLTCDWLPERPTEGLA